MESGNKLRESSRKKIEELLIEGNHKRSDGSQNRSRNNSSKTNINTSETINDEVNVLQTKRYKEIHEFKSELKNLLSDKINLSSSVKESFIADVVKNISKLLIKVSIYPTKDECYGAVEGYLILNYASFFSNFTEDDWIAYYNENIHKQLTKQVQSIRGTLPIQKNESQGQNSSIVLASVIDRVLQGGNSNAELAYVLVTCSTILNPHHDEIMLKKNIMKQKVKKFLEKINNQTAIKYSDFEDNSYEEEEGGNETEDDEEDDV
ncbi:hypothetical protein GLOIN_2v1880888 [Rhizophagus irregularis DAOM 181602=DAOM 197198]|nr:hypothetical protein GLOIN_2v1880888 [Rhizophagus irregularis DAOM 181602=DAOM 197198]